MSYTRLAALGVVPGLLLLGGLAMGGADGIALGVLGGVSLLFVVARFADVRKRG